jgi:hypothetical protein
MAAAAAAADMAASAAADMVASAAAAAVSEAAAEAVLAEAAAGEAVAAAAGAVVGAAAACRGEAAPPFARLEQFPITLTYAGLHGLVFQVRRGQLASCLQRCPAGARVGRAPIHAGHAFTSGWPPQAYLPYVG